MRVVCARKESALGLRGAIPSSEALDRNGLADLASEKEPGAGVCRLLEVESEGAAFGERALRLGEADRRDGTLVCLALRPARGTNISAPSTRAPAIGRPTSTVTPCRKRVAVAFWRNCDTLPLWDKRCATPGWATNANRCGHRTSRFPTLDIL